MNKLKGYVAIEKKQGEHEQGYKYRLVDILYSLITAYNALPKEIHQRETAFDDDERISMMREEPDEKESPFDTKRRHAFVNHHYNNGWNKKLPEDSIDDVFVFGHEELEENQYICDDDFIHWVRTINGDERSEIDAYLLKYIDYAHIDDFGVSIFNGIMFYDDYSRELHGKFQRVIKTLASVLEEQGISYHARIERKVCCETVTEHLRKTNDGKLEWVVSKA